VLRGKTRSNKLSGCGVARGYPIEGAEEIHRLQKAASDLTASGKVKEYQGLSEVLPERNPAK